MVATGTRKIGRDDYRRLVREIDQEMAGKPYTPSYLASRLGIDPKTNKRYLSEYDVGWPVFSSEPAPEPAPVQRPARRMRLCLKAVLGVILLAEFTVTLLWNDWLERVTHIDIDHDHGMFELLVDCLMWVVSIVLWWLLFRVT